MAEKLSAGIIGGGFMAKVHSRAIRNSGHRVIGIASSSPESAARASDELDIQRAYDSWGELIDSSEVDVIHICTPNETHAEIIQAAARAGKDIVCEKPISTSLDEALEIQAVLSSSQSRLAIPYVYRFYPIVREMRARIGEGETGAIHLIHGSYLQDWLADSSASNWRLDSVKGGASRAFADIGIHWCDLMEFISGDRISRLIAHTSKAYESRAGVQVQTEDIANVMFETERGASGTLTVSQVSPGRKNRLWLELDGENKSLCFDQEQPNAMWMGGQHSNQTVVSGHETLTHIDSSRLAVVPSGHPQGYQDAFNAFVLDAYSEFQGERIDGVPRLLDGLRSATLVDAVLTSAEQQRWVDVKSLEDVSSARLLAS